MVARSKNLLLLIWISFIGKRLEFRVDHDIWNWTPLATRYQLNIETLRMKVIKVLEKPTGRKNPADRPKTRWLGVTLNDISSRSEVRVCTYTTLWKGFWTKMVGSIMSIRQTNVHITYVRATGIDISMILLPQHRLKLQLILSSVASYLSHVLK